MTGKQELSVLLKTIIPQLQPVGARLYQKWSNFFPKVQVQFSLSYSVNVLTSRVLLSLYTGNVRQSLI